MPWISPMRASWKFVSRVSVSDKDEALDEVAHEGRVAALGDVAHQLDGDLIGGDAGVNGLPAGEVGDDIFGDRGLEGLEP